jgi:hypothetical protein
MLLFKLTYKRFGFCLLQSTTGVVLKQTTDTGKKTSALQRHNAENSKQIFPENKLRGLSPNFHIHVSVSFFYKIPSIGLPILLQENMWTDPGNI